MPPSPASTALAGPVCPSADRRRRPLPRPQVGRANPTPPFTERPATPPSPGLVTHSRSTRGPLGALLDNPGGQILVPWE
eukprot:2457148-Lingulodinium_polyedra.AAC.1